MKITRYSQSCLLIEDSIARILIDASGEESGRLNEFGKLDAVFYTHEHSDHFDPELAQKFMEAGTPVYANTSTAKKMRRSPNVLQNDREQVVSGLRVKAIELPHCPMPDGSAGPQNTGLLINGKFFHPGDGKELAGLRVDNLALPITGPDISMRDAFAFAEQLKAKICIPIHYDKVGANPDVYSTFAGYFPKFTFSIKPLRIGQSIEI